MMFQTRIEEIGERSLLAAKEYLLQGECVAFPTETVYGLGADARSDASPTSTPSRAARKTTRSSCTCTAGTI